MFSLRKDLPVLTDCGYFSGGALKRDMGFFKFFKVFFLMQCLRSLLCNCFLVFPWHKPIPLSYQIVCYMTTPNEEHEECWMYIGDVIIRGIISFFSFFFEGGGPVQSRYFFNFCCAKFTYIIHAIKLKWFTDK